MQPKIQDGQDSGGAQLDSQWPMNWRETTPGRYERDVDETETFYTVLARMYESTGRALFAITGYVELSVMIPEARIIRRLKRKSNLHFRRHGEGCVTNIPPLEQAWSTITLLRNAKKCTRLSSVLKMARKSQAGWICRSKRSTTDALD